jgi:hypothetical protein
LIVFSTSGTEINDRRFATIFTALIATCGKHGPSFAKGCGDDEKLSDVLHRLDEPSLRHLIRDDENGQLNEIGIQTQRIVHADEKVGKFKRERYRATSVSNATI